jgi:uncharacterized repeat protein (TIGR03803 family)
MQAQTFTTLHSFDNGDGGNPVASLVQATNGALYGTASSGGANGAGTVFKISTAGKLTTLHNFCSQSNCTDGYGPVAPLIQATNEVLYGTASSGGANGAGTVFQITAAGKLTTLYSFCSQSNCTDGEAPLAPLVQASNGDLYGTTSGGGANGAGTVFQITTAGKLTTLYNFCSQSDCADGSYPAAALIQASDGNFYGTTYFGGVNYCSGDQELTDNCGTVFRITPAGKLTTLYSFSYPDGTYPAAALVQAANGDLYGTTSSYGAGLGGGTVFQITTSGALTTIYNFCQYFTCPTGLVPLGALIQASNGGLYGTASGGGTNEVGTVFQIAEAGALTTLYSFCSQPNCADGFGPAAALVQATNGTFYGTAEYGGTSDACGTPRYPYSCGTVFSLSTGLGPFVETQPNSGKVGARVKILGTNLKGATSVTFNGTAAVFNVASGSEITTKVPAGASTGPVQVVTPGGTLTSNLNFQVN